MKWVTPGKRCSRRSTETWRRSIETEMKGTGCNWNTNLNPDVKNASNIPLLRIADISVLPPKNIFKS